MSKALNTVTSRDTELTQQNIYTMLSSLTLFNMYTLDLSTRLRHTQFINYSEGITVTATHSYCNTQQQLGSKSTHTCTASTLDPRQQKFILNSDKTTCTFFTPDPEEYNTRLYLLINNSTRHAHTSQNIGPHL